MAGERIKFADGPTDDMPLEMAEFMIREMFKNKRSQFAGSARTYYLGLYGGQKKADETADETAEE